MSEGSSMRPQHSRAIQRLRDKYEGDPRYRALIIVGSVATGEASEGADVDHLIVATDEEFARRHILPLFRRPGPPVPNPASRPNGFDWRELKTWLLQQIAWGGLPQIELVDVNAEGDGELLLVHRHDGRDLQIGHARETLLNVASLWRAPVHLLTVVEKQGRRLVAKEGEVTMLDTREAEGLCCPGGSSGDGAEDGRKAG